MSRMPSMSSPDRPAQDAVAAGPELVVIYDGLCGLCAAVVQFVLPRDRRERIAFAAAQSEVGRSLQAEVGIEALADDTLVVVMGGRALVRSDAALAIAARLDGLWPLLRFLRWVPRAVRDAVYGWIARHRYRWFGRRQACLVPPPGWESRFLDSSPSDPASPG